MLTIRDLGCVEYRRALQMQADMRDQRQRADIGDHLLLLEHPPVFTTGRRDASSDFLSTPADIAADGIDIVNTERGGRVTYHGPGQLVGYLICHIGELGFSVRDIVHAVEELCLRTVSDFGVQGTRDCQHPGIWVNGEKIAAVGMHISQQVSMHGFALNVSPDLSHYRHVIACGIADRGVTSLEKIQGRAALMADVKARLMKHAEKIFQSRSAVNAKTFALDEASEAGLVASTKSMSISSDCCAESSIALR